MSDIHIYTLESPVRAISSCAQHLSQLLARYEGQDVFLLVSGGSVLSVLDVIETAHVGSCVRMCLVDERYSVAKEDENYYQLSQTDFAQRFIAAGGLVCDTSLAGCDSLSSAREHFESHVSSIVKKVRDGSASIITILGIGPDGHTAGMMPYPDNPSLYNTLFNGSDNSFVVGYDAGDRSSLPLRVTVNMPFLCEFSAHTLVYSVGEQKKAVLQEIVHTSEPINVYPGRIIHDMQDVHIYTDQEITK